MGGHVGAKKIPTNRQKQLHAARAVATRDLFNNAACQSRIQHQWTCSTTSSVPDDMLDNAPRAHAIVIFLSILEHLASCLLCSALPPPCPNQMS